MRQLLIAWIVVAAALAGVSLAQEPRTKPNHIVIRQQAISDQACGPCSVYNSLANARNEYRAALDTISGSSPDQRIQRMIRTHGSKPSLVFAENQSRYTVGRGMAPEDLPHFWMDVLAPTAEVKLAGSYLDRRKNETQPEHLRRIHSTIKRAIDAGLPPIIDVQAYAAHHSGGRFVWDRITGHFVALVDVQADLPAEDNQFRFRYTDSLTGKIETGYASLEEARPYCATRHFSIGPDGSLTWTWLEGYPYLTVSSSSLRLSTDQEPFQTRTIIVMRHIVGVESALFPAN